MIIDKLLKRLHSVFNKSPDKIPVMTISCTAGSVVTLEECVMRTRAIPVSPEQGTPDHVVTNYDIDLSNNITINTFIDMVNSDPDYSATLLDASYGSYAAWGLLPVKNLDITQAQTLYYPTSLLYNEMQVYGRLLDEQAGRLKVAEKQLYLKSAEADWLDFWCNDYFGIPRYTVGTEQGQGDESDDIYAQRTVYTVLRPTQNNVALALIVKDALGYTVALRDAEPHIAELPPEFQDDAVGRFILDMRIPNEYSEAEAEALINKVKDVVRKYKAAGTDFLDSLWKWSTWNEHLSFGEQVALTVGSGPDETFQEGYIRVGAGWQVGTPGLKVGLNDPIKEQIFIELYYTTEHEHYLVSSQLLGG